MLAPLVPGGVPRRPRGARAVVPLLRLWLGLLLTTLPLVAAQREVLNFNPDWKFLKADPAGAAAPAFDDSAWKTVSAPHTYNDMDTFDDWSMTGHRGEQNQWGGRTWYRKSFVAPASFKGKKVFVEFEAVRQVAEVYLNGKLLGVCKTGFTPFGLDLTPHLRLDATNVLAVMCDNRFMKDPWVADAANEEPRLPGEEQKAPKGGGKLSELAAKFNAEIPEDVEQLRADQIPWNNPHWHPAHGGIYRNVYLHVTDPLHVSLPLYSFLKTAGPYAYASSVSASAATVTVEVPVENGRDREAQVEVLVQVCDPAGKPVLELKQSDSVGSGASKTYQLSGNVPNPNLWEPGYPYVYRVVCSLRAAGETVDNCSIPLGIRAVRWDLATGFYINGKHLKLHGWGQKPTEEWPGLGAALPDWMHVMTLQQMKDAGGNFLRWGHCAGPPAGVAAADQLGLITVQPGVDGESDTRGAAWKVRVDAFRDTLIYFRNHPAILVWEGGNQKVTRDHVKELHSILEQYDPHGGRAYTHRRSDKITGEFMDVALGTEGGHENPQLPVIEGEYNREESPRRVWDDASPPNFGYPEAKGQTYQLTSEQFAVNEVAQFVRKLGAAEHCGGANWIFSDSTSGGRVACEVARASGEVDAVRLPKEAYYVSRTMFRADPQVHIVGHWNYPEGTQKNVFVAANGDEVELFVNGSSLGKGTRSDRYLFTFPNVKWQPGEIKAVSLVGGRPVASQVKRTAASPAALRLALVPRPGQLLADGSDVALFDIEAVDASGQRCPTFQKPANFEISGPAQWVGGYESGRTNSIGDHRLLLECGITRVAIRATRSPGQITVRALCEGLPQAMVSIRSVAFPLANGFSTIRPAMQAIPLPQASCDPAAGDTMPVLPPT